MPVHACKNNYLGTLTIPRYMTIYCRQHEWADALAWFADPTTVATMQRLGMRVQHLDHETHCVSIETNDDGNGIEELERWMQETEALLQEIQTLEEQGLTTTTTQPHTQQ